MKLSSRRSNDLHLYCLASLLVILGSGLAFSQEPIHVAVNLVNVAFSVRDARGALVENLAKEDVEILEDAVPQKISFFAKSTDVPLTLGLIVDVSGSQDHFSKQHEHDLEVFLKEVLGPKDRAFLVTFANHIRLISDFSPSGAEIIERMQEYKGQDKRQGQKEARGVPGTRATREPGLGHSLLRLHLLCGEGEAREGERQAGAAGVQRRRRQFQFARHDDYHRDGSGRKCGGVCDSVYGKRTWETDGAK